MMMPVVGLLLFDEVHYIRNPETNSQEREESGRMFQLQSRVI